MLSRWAQVRAHAPAELRDRLPAELPPAGLVLDADRASEGNDGP